MVNGAIFTSRFWGPSHRRWLSLYSSGLPAALPVCTTDVVACGRNCCGDSSRACGASASISETPLLAHVPSGLASGSTQGAALHFSHQFQCREIELSCPNVVSPAFHSQVALRVMELVLWWTRRVGVPQNPSAEPAPPGGRGGGGAGGWEAARRWWDVGGVCRTKTRLKPRGRGLRAQHQLPCQESAWSAAKESCPVSRDGPRVAAALGRGQPTGRCVHPSVRL